MNDGVGWVGDTEGGVVCLLGEGRSRVQVAISIARGSDLARWTIIQVLE